MVVLNLGGTRDRTRLRFRLPATGTEHLSVLFDSRLFNPNLSCEGFKLLTYDVVLSSRPHCNNILFAVVLL